MNLAACYNLFDGIEHLAGSMNCLKDHVHRFILVYQKVSNWGERYDPLPEINAAVLSLGIPPEKVILVEYHLQYPTAMRNEETKRTIACEVAYESGCTHFMSVDADEYYLNFGEAVMEYQYSFSAGSVCRMFTYFKKPTLRLENVDNYYVPFIHKLSKDTICGHYDYPYYVDPTRKVNTKQVVLLQTCMHHMSWVRRDIGLKIRNSTAKLNIEKSNLLNHYHDPNTGSGTYLVDYGQKLIEVDNIFNITWNTAKSF